MPRLGERFFRAPGNSATGTGLGLAIARAAVDHMHGHIAYHDVAHGGLKVSIRLPGLKRG